MESLTTLNRAVMLSSAGNSFTWKQYPMQIRD